MYQKLAFLLLLAVPLSLQPWMLQEKVSGAPAYNVEEAQKVLRAIDKIDAESKQPWSGPLREVVISESELNSYIAYRIENEHEEIMKALRLKLFPDNKVEGMIHVDLRGPEGPLLTSVPRWISSLRPTCSSRTGPSRST